MVDFSKTTPGGKYLRPDGKTLVDANGKPLKGKGDEDTARQKAVQSAIQAGTELAQEFGEGGSTAGRSAEELEQRQEDFDSELNPEAVGIRGLEKHLQQFGDVSHLQRLKDADTRTTSWPIYDARIAELEG